MNRQASLNNQMIYIGFDASLTHTGWCAIYPDGSIKYGVFKTVPNPKLKAGVDHFYRQQKLREDVRGLITFIGVYDEDDAGARFLQDIAVCIEHTDWSRGRKDSRDSWIIETIARESLAIATSTLFGVCLELGITPIIVGPNEWKRAIGEHSKEGGATWVAANWQDVFDIRIKEYKLRGKRTHGQTGFKRIVVERATGKEVPDHVTDALAMCAMVKQARERERLGE